MRTGTRRNRALLPAALCASALVLLGGAERAVARQYIGTRPPTGSERRGLMRAFRARHPNRRKATLVGFRVFEHDPAAAAYYLVPGDATSYARAATELYRRTGSRWSHVRRFRNKTRDFNDAYGLVPGFLWKVSSEGTGTWDVDDTQTLDNGDTVSDTVHATFQWSETYAGGRALRLGEGAFYRSSAALTGQLSATETDAQDPSSNSSCAGPVTSGQGSGDPAGVSFAVFPEYGNARGLDYSLTLAPVLRWPDCSFSPELPDAARLLAGARIPVGAAESAGIFSQGGLHPRLVLQARAFSHPVDDHAPSVVKETQPKQSHSGQGDSSNTDLELSGTLHFTLAGLYMPLGLLGTPHPPVRADGHVPPVL